MDYIKIVLEGYIDNNNRKYLAEYFVREQKKASKAYFGVEEFFSGCENVIANFAADIKRQLYKEKSECYFAIGQLKARTMKFSQPDPSMTHEEQSEYSLKGWQKQLESLSIDNYCVNLYPLNYGYYGHLWDGDLKVISNAINSAKKIISENDDQLKSEHIDNKDLEFINIILKGLKELQTQDVNADCIKNIKKENNKLEAPFRNWFKTFFSGKYDIVNAEPEKGNGRIDLKIEDSGFGTRIIEFKGWWNSDKKVIVDQIISYLTDFETNGYIIIINDKQKKIDNNYFELIKSESVKYIENSFQEILLQNSDYKYFISNHSDNIRTKKLFHFIYNVH